MFMPDRTYDHRLIIAEMQISLKDFSAFTHTKLISWHTAPQPEFQISIQAGSQFPFCPE
jgi:hypothetical protein